MGRRRAMSDADIQKFVKDCAKLIPMETLVKTYKLDETTLYKYMKNPEIKQLINERKSKRVHDKMYEVAIDGDIRAIELYVKVEEGFNPTQKVEGNIKADMTLTDLINADR